jgi:hypothetical protein
VNANIAQFHRQATHNTHNKKKTFAADWEKKKKKKKKFLAGWEKKV